MQLVTFSISLSAVHVIIWSTVNFFSYSCLTILIFLPIICQKLSGLLSFILITGQSTFSKILACDRSQHFSNIVLNQPEALLRPVALPPDSTLIATVTGMIKVYQICSRLIATASLTSSVKFFMTCFHHFHIYCCSKNPETNIGDRMMCGWRVMFCSNS